MKLHLGSVVRAARQRAALTQEELAARIDRTPESVSNIERGVHLPTLETLADLGRVLGVPLPEFFDGAQDHAPSRERLRLEARLREVARALSDRNLAIAVAQADVLLEHGSDRR